MLRRFAAPLLVLLPVLLVLGCENNLLEPDLRGAIEGQVFDFDTREPLSGVNITTNPPTGSLITDENGSFRLDDLPVGNYSIAGRRSGYDSNSITISVLDGETRTAILLLGGSVGGRHHRDRAQSGGLRPRLLESIPGR